ncbi:MAG: hypothetical protein WAM14_18360 [Candidatus Nitrosopolaris sp.]
MYLTLHPYGPKKFRLHHPYDPCSPPVLAVTGDTTSIDTTTAQFNLMEVPIH